MYREDIYAEARKVRDDYLACWLEPELGPPARMGDSYAIWEGDYEADGHGAQVIVRFRSNGGVSLNARWVDGDGHVNGLYAPKDYDDAAWLVRDAKRVLADRTAGRTLGNQYRGEVGNKSWHMTAR